MGRTVAWDRECDTKCNTQLFSDSSWPCTNKPLSWKFSKVNSVLKSTGCHNDSTYVSSACVSYACFEDDLTSNLCHHSCALLLRDGFSWAHCGVCCVCLVTPVPKAGCGSELGAASPLCLCSGEGEEQANHCVLL